jgi:hypothetical protein
MKKSIVAALVILSAVLPALAQNISLIPKPAVLKKHTGHFKLNKLTKIVVPATDPETRKLHARRAYRLSVPGVNYGEIIKRHPFKAE